MTEAEQQLLRPYVTNVDRPVYALRQLPEEVVAVLFAYYSRSTNSLRENLLTLIAAGDLALQPGGAPVEVGSDAALAEAQKRARAFHEKWVIGYGHGSVAEHAVVHLAVEDLSIVATKALEDNRLASYTEKSTRYVQFDEERFVREPSIAASGLAAEYEATCRFLLGTYTRLLPVVVGQVAERFPQPADWTARRYETTCRAKAFDLLRYLLPASTRTNVGLTANARTLEHMLTKLYSHPLAELRELAATLHREAVQIVPTLIKYAAANPYLEQTPPAVAALAAQLPTPPEPPTANRVCLVASPPEPTVDLAAAILYEQTAISWSALRQAVADMPADARQEVIDAYLSRRGKYDAPLRGLEHIVYTFEVTLDYGAYRDIQRHRMCTQTAQVLGTRLGYETPPELVEMGHQSAYDEALARSAACHGALLGEVSAEAAQYVLPLAWRKRLLMTMNLRELHHFVSLRSSRQGHVSYRKIAQDCWHELDRVHPALAAAVRVDHEQYDLARA